MAKNKTIVEQVAESTEGRPGLARLLDVSEQAVHGWIKVGFFPPLQAIRLERIKKGKLKAVKLAAPTPEDDGKE